MSKYDDLVPISTNDITVARKLQADGRTFLVILLKALVDHLGFPSANLYRISSSNEQIATLHPEGFRMEDTEGCFVVNIGMNFGSQPHGAVTLYFGKKRLTAKSYNVRIGLDGPWQNIDEDPNEEELKEFANKIYLYLKDYFENGIEKYLSGASKVRPMGFV